MVLSLLKITPRGGKRDDVIQILTSVVGPTIAHSGCRSCEVASSSGEDYVFLIESWLTVADLYRHLRSDLYLRVLAAMEYSCPPPEFDVFESVEPSGIRLIEQVRAGPGSDPWGRGPDARSPGQVKP